MARGWRVLDASRSDGEVSGRRGRILIQQEDLVDSVPAEEIAIVLVGPRTTLASEALHYAAKHGITILASDWRNIPYAGLFPWGTHTRVAARHLAQATLTLPRKKNAWMQLVKAKIRGQAETIRAINHRTANRLTSIAKAVRSGDPENAEGLAARIYWSELFIQVPNFTRDQDGTDGINSMLNYGYTVLRGFAIRSVLGAGLNPPLGVFHRGRSNYFNLVDDLIEPFRPAIDHVAAGFPAGMSLDSVGIRGALVQAATQPFMLDGTRIPAALDDLAQQFGRYAEGDIQRLFVQEWQGPQPVTTLSNDA